MKKNKILITLFVSLFILSGCDVTYDLKIDEKMNVTEQVVGLEESEYNDLAHDFLLDRISLVYVDRYSSYNNVYEFDYVMDGTKMGNTMKREYSTLAQYSSKSAVLNDLIKNYSITESDNIVSINISVNDNIYSPDDLAHIIIPDNININIDLPFLITNSNADIQNGNVHTWKITNDKRETNIILSFDKNKLRNHIYVLNIGISYVILLVMGIVTAIGLVAIVVSKNIKGINKI